MLLVCRQPQRQILITSAPIQLKSAATKEHRKKEISRKIESEKFSRWRAKQVAKTKEPAAFQTQVLFYVHTGSSLALYDGI